MRSSSHKILIPLDFDIKAPRSPKLVDKFIDTGDRKHDWPSVIIEGHQGPQIAKVLAPAETYIAVREQ